MCSCMRRMKKLALAPLLLGCHFGIQRRPNSTRQGRYLAIGSVPDSLLVGTLGLFAGPVDFWLA